MSGRPTPSSISSAAVGAFFCKGMSDRMFDELMSHVPSDIDVAVLYFVMVSILPYERLGISGYVSYPSKKLSITTTRCL